MNLFERVKKASKMIFQGSSFEASNFSTKRSRVPGVSPTDFKHEYQGGTRLEVVRNSRYLMKNSGLFREQRDLNYIYGTGVDGLTPFPLVDSMDWISDAMLYWEEWSRSADLSGRFSMPELTALASKAVDTDGEIFFAKVIDSSTGSPKLLPIETHRVGNFQDAKATTSSKWIDGIRVDVNGRPLSYKVLQDGGATRNIRANHMLHIFNAESTSAYRHAPTLVHSILHGLDEIEILALEKHAVKQNSDMVVALKRAMGKLDNDGDFSLADDDDIFDGSAPASIQEITGGKVVAIGENEEMQFHEPKRPSPAFTGFLQHLRLDSSLGGLPYEVAVSASGSSGPAVRLAIAKAQRRFKARTSLISNRFVRPTWFFVIGHAIDNGILPPIKDWSKIRVTPPREMTVDAGRDSESNRRDVVANLKLPSQSYEEDGMGFREAIYKKAQDVKIVEEIAKETGVKPEWLFDFAAGEKANGVAGTAPSGS